MNWDIFKWVIVALFIAGAMLLSVISLKKHGEFLVKLGKINPSLASSLDWDYYGDGASRRSYQIMIFFYRKKYEDIKDEEIAQLGNEIRCFYGYAILLTVISLVTLSLLKS
jgi:hypothetical protein